MSWSGFYDRTRQERLAMVAAHAGLDDDDVAALGADSALPHGLAETFIENAVGSFPLPLGFAVNFLIDGRDTVIPMAVEESSVVAAASHGAKLAAAGGGFHTQAMDPVTYGQIEVRDVADANEAVEMVHQLRQNWIETANQTIPSMVARGGGVKEIAARVIRGAGADRLVLHLHVDTQDAMGANVVNSLCETLGLEVAQACGGRPGLRILSNLATHRMAQASCTIPAQVLGGDDVVTGILEAVAFAQVDPFRAATHNKGIMNGIDPVLIATGNDWRAVEAGAHAYAAMEGQYGPLSRFATTDDGDLDCTLRMPLAVGTVGGVTHLHPVAKACLRVLGDPSGPVLARTCAAVGLAQNIAALRALATEGIQAGHMELHAGNEALASRDDS